MSEAERGFIAGFHTPILFYGRVVDQHGAPVAQAEVKLTANDDAFGNRVSEYTRQSDTEGNFSIEGIVGLTLYVVVSKPGYRRIPRTNSRIVTSSALFDYGIKESVHLNLPDKNAPVVFTLHKVGPVEPLVRIEEKTSRMVRDGSPLSISLDQQGGHAVVVRCWSTDQQRPSGQRTFDWRLEISVPSGGLMAREDAFAFEAPEGGYLPSDTIKMPMSLERQWRSLVPRAYFIRFEDGTFARVKMEIHAGGGHFVVWESFFNPKPGSRNLESDPRKEVAP